MSKKNIVVFGATSAVAQSVCRIYAHEKCNFYLVGRNSQQLQIISDDLKVRGASEVVFQAQDLAEIEEMHNLVKKIQIHFKKIDIALIAHGSLPNQFECEQDWRQTEMAFKVNALSAIALIHELANLFETQKEGALVAISSVAGDRGRKSNYVYGAAKSFVSVFMDGVRNRLSSSNIQVLTIKPGFIDTPMTASFKKGILWSKPQKVAQDIVKAIEKKNDITYTPWFWKFIMLIIKNIPEKIFKRMKL